MIFAFQNLLYDVDSLIYVDTDILFLTSLRKLWRLFGDFNDSQSVALVPESEDAPTGWYNRFARHPYVYPLGKFPHRRCVHGIAS